MKATALTAVTLALLAFHAQADTPKVACIGDWDVEVTLDGTKTVLHVERPLPIAVTAEKYASLRDYNPKGGGWTRGTALLGVRAQECTTRNALLPGSLKVASAPGNDAVVYENGKDYQLTEDWATVGRLPEGRIKAGQPVYMSYTYTKLRIDAIVRTAQGTLAIRPGEPHPANPAPAELQPGDTRIANIWFNGFLDKLTDDNLFPILETAYPEPPRAPNTPTVAEQLLPKTMAKLKNGGTLRILAWGDSVTVGTFVPDYQNNRWQNQFVNRLKAKYPNATIELITEAWGGRNTTSYLNQPKGAEHNYEETVLAVKPDLVISEFVNDAWYTEKNVNDLYSKFLADFKAMGSEWIILTPHYVRPDWMGLKSEKNIDQDPRVYVTAIRKFAAQNNIALADTSLRFGRLWRQGIPHSSLMMNAINHPNPFGMKQFADALMALF